MLVQNLVCESRFFIAGVYRFEAEVMNRGAEVKECMDQLK
jgi:hypothetical protein